MANTKLKNKLTKKNVKYPRLTEKSLDQPEPKMETVEIPGLFQPNEYDIADELTRMDSFSHREYNE